MPTQSTDVFADPNGITYTADGQTWKILKGVDVTGVSVGVFSEFADSILNNSGSIFGDEVGVYFNAFDLSDYVIRNQKKGEIEGGGAGVAVVGFNGSAFVQNKGSIASANWGVYFDAFDGLARLQNKGSIEGAEIGLYAEDFLGSVRVLNKGMIEGGQAGAFFEDGSSAVEIVNHGTIKGTEAGIGIEVDTVGAFAPVIDNYGMVRAFEYAIYVIGATGVEVEIVNHKGATIDGSTYGIVVLEKLNLANEGRIDGIVISGNYEDRVVNKGKIDDLVYLGEGNDVFKNKGKKAQADLIDTQYGNDLVVLGKKADKLLFASTLDAASNVDTVKKFTSGKDMIYLDDGVFTLLPSGALSTANFHEGTSAADAEDRIIYDKATGALYYDPDGLGGVAQTQFAKLEAGAKLKASDFTVGDYGLVL